MMLITTSSQFDRLHKRRRLCAALGIGSMVVCALISAIAIATSI